MTAPSDEKEPSRSSPWYAKICVEVVGWIGVVVNWLYLIGTLAGNRTTANLIGSILGILVYTLLIVAKRTGIPVLFVPFIILNFIYFIFEVIAVLYVVVLFTSGSTYWQKHFLADFGMEIFQGSSVGFGIGVVAFLAITIAWTCFAQYVVSYAYRCTKEESNQEH